MKIIPKNIIHQWYQIEYNHTEADSIYKASPPQLQRFYDLLEKNKDTVKMILDLGCGDGRSMIELAKQGFEVTGIDLAGKKIAERRAKEHGVHIRFIENDITLFPFEREKYDAIISSEVFHLIPRRAVENILDRMILATNRKGFVYVSILSNLKRYFLKTREQFQYEDQTDFSVEESKKMLRIKFADWGMIDIDTFHDEQDWPVKPGNYPVERYHWSGEYVYLIAKKR